MDREEQGRAYCDRLDESFQDQTGVSESAKKGLDSGWEKPSRLAKKCWILSSLPRRNFFKLERMELI